MSQRGITQKLLDLTVEFGVESQKGNVILNRQGLNILMAALKQLQKTAEKGLNKGGLVIVRRGDAFITTYALDSYDRRLARRSGS